MTRSDMPQEWPKRCFSWPEEALLTNDEDFIYLPWQQGLRGWRLNCGKTLQNAAGEKEIIRISTRKMTKAEIMAQCPDISLKTVQRALEDLLKNGEIIKIGGGRYTSYIWNRE